MRYLLNHLLQMTRTFEYMARVVVDNDITIDDIGNCSLKANNDLGKEWYLIISTELGWTEVFEVGPIIPDVRELPVAVNWSYKRIEYSESKVSNIIDRFLNDGYRGITQVQQISKEEAKSNFRNLADYI